MQISFQEFKNKLLEPGLVDHIVISNKSVAKVYVRSSPQNLSGSTDSTEGSDFDTPVSDTQPKAKTSQYKYYFNIGSVETFEEKLEEAQEALGIDPHDYVPVTYVSEGAWLQELMRFAPTLLLLGSLFFISRKMQAGFGVGGGGGKGGRGIFNIGKAHFTKMDKNAKNKVFFLFAISFSLYGASLMLNIIVLTFSYLHSRFTSKMLLAVMKQNKRLWSLYTS